MRPEPAWPRPTPPWKSYSARLSGATAVACAALSTYRESSGRSHGCDGATVVGWGDPRSAPRNVKARKTFVWRNDNLAVAHALGRLQPALFALSRLRAVHSIHPR